MIFISHSSKEDLVANQICEYLETHDIKCWMDHRDANPGDLWEVSIVTAIKSSKIMLIIFSKNANLSKHVGKELTIAAKAELDIIPLKIEDIKPNEKFEYYLTDIQWYDAISKPFQKHLSSLIVNINMLLSAFNDHNVQDSYDNIINPKLPLELNLIRKELEIILDQFIDDSDYLKFYFKRVLWSDWSVSKKILWATITGRIINDWNIYRKNKWKSFKPNLEIAVRYLISKSETSECFELFKFMFP